MLFCVVFHSLLCLFSVVSCIEMPVFPQNGSAKYKLVCMNMNWLSILFTESLKALQTVSQHACQKNQGLCVNE